VGRSLCTIEGEIEPLLRDPQFASAEGARVRVILTDEVLPLQAMARLRGRFPFVAELRHRPPDVVRSTASERNQQVRQAASPLALATSFFADQQGREANEAEAELLHEALKAVGKGGER
ncbi:MAG: exonuclease SbcCD subunit D C-terminal domain-containing protein, partial [Cyanobacteriota bacterium]